MDLNCSLSLGNLKCGRLAAFVAAVVIIVAVVVVVVVSFFFFFCSVAASSLCAGFLKPGEWYDELYGVSEISMWKTCPAASEKIVSLKRELFA